MVSLSRPQESVDGAEDEGTREHRGMLMRPHSTRTLAFSLTPSLTHNHARSLSLSCSVSLPPSLFHRCKQWPMGEAVQRARPLRPLPRSPATLQAVRGEQTTQHTTQHTHPPVTRHHSRQSHHRDHQTIYSNPHLHQEPAAPRALTLLTCLPCSTHPYSRRSLFF